MARVRGRLSARAVLMAERFGARALPSRDLRWWVSRLGFGADAPAAQVRFVEAMHRATPSWTSAELLPSLAAFDLSARLGRSTCPPWWWWAPTTGSPPPRHARRLAAGLPDAELVELPRCGHQPMLERRHEFSRLIDEFSAKIS